MTPSSPTNLLIAAVRDGISAEKHLPSLRRLLQSCVNDDPISSIGFFAPLSDHDAIDYWLSLLPSAISPAPTATTTLLVATDPQDPSSVIATVQITRYAKETHAYKGEIRKLLVHPDHRRGGLGRRMMLEAERVAKEDLGMEMLILDTAFETPARRFYLNLGWREWGICPDYAKTADGRKGDCSFFVKML